MIDADNVSADYVGPIFDEISNHGAPIMKRIYGDWTQPSLAKWKPVLLEYSIIPIQQYSYTSGKNATDSALIIDAMDILYSQNIDGFCIVSSDSDFTRLASRLREAGKSVIGMGEKKTPSAFVNACEQFKYLEILADSGKDEVEEEVPKQPAAKSPGPTRAVLSKAIGAIIDDVSDGEGWAPLGAVGQRLNTRYPAFDSRNYGFKKLSLLVDSFPRFEVVSRTLPNQHEAQTFIRLKETAKRAASKRASAKKAAEESTSALEVAVKEEPAKAPARRTTAKTVAAAALPPKEEAAEKRAPAKKAVAEAAPTVKETSAEKKPSTRRTAAKAVAAVPAPVEDVPEIVPPAPKATRVTTRRTTARKSVAVDPNEESIAARPIRKTSTRRTTASTRSRAATAKNAT